MNNKNNKQENYKKISCPFCRGKEVVRRGTFETKAHGKQQRYFCKSCSKKFIEQTPFYRMRNNPQKITLCLDLFYKGVSTRQVQEHLQQFYPHNSSWVSIYNWVIKYSKQISQFTDKLKLNVGRELQIDEMEVGKRTSKFNGWFIDSIDTKTRYMVASEFTKKRDLTEVKAVLGLAKQKTEKQFKIITSDGWLAYPKAITQTFGYYNFQRKEIIHNQVNASKGEGFNYKIERLHNSIRQRIKVCRGFHGSVESANTLMKGYEVFYNFIRKHQSLKGKTPSELATDIKLNGNKWLELIHLSNQSI
jgi:transposase-like protein